MPERRWTILIVPSDNGKAREFTVTDRTRRTLLWGAASGVATVLAAIVYLATPFATPASRALMAENSRLRSQLATLDQRLMALGDTIALLGRRDQEIRAFAGLPEDSLAAVAGVGSASRAPALPRPFAGDSAPATIVSVLPSAPRSRPFLNRLGFGSPSTPDLAELSRRASALVASFSAVSDSLNRNLERLANTPSIMPTAGWLSSQFSQSRFHPILHENRAHEGIDVAAPMGAPIIAPAGGVVRGVTREAGYGNTFEIDHGNGIVTRFAHCSRILVRDGQVVTRAQLIATVGNTGLSIGPHLHYEVHVDGKPVDPLKYVLPEKAEGGR